MKVLVMSHGHPAFSIGGAEIASYNLFRGLNRLPGCHSHYLARVGPPVAPHKGTPFMSLRQGEHEQLWWSDNFDWFQLGNPDLESLMQHLDRWLRELRPDVVHLHHVIGFGVQVLLAIRNALGDVPLLLTLHEYLPICHHHGQMLRRGRWHCVSGPRPRSAQFASRRSPPPRSCAASCLLSRSSIRSTVSCRPAVS